MNQEGQQQQKQGQVEGALIQEGQPLPLDELHFQILGEDNKPQVHEHEHEHTDIASHFTEMDCLEHTMTTCRRAH